ncbi:MAG: hypothetical protein JO216_14880 [Hyphomicrobiales bacterium]|nr:hypothetical protein [Hyphomicrobiales bacterium]
MIPDNLPAPTWRRFGACHQNAWSQWNVVGRRYALFKYFQRRWTNARLQIVELLLNVIMTGMGMAVRMGVVMAAAAEEENARNVDDQSEHGNWNCLIKADWNGPDKACQGLVTRRKRSAAGFSGHIWTFDVFEVVSPS